MIEEDVSFNKTIQMLGVLKRLGLYEWIYPERHSTVISVGLVNEAIRRMKGERLW